MNWYQSAEREVLRAYAFQVLTDPTSTPEDRARAEARLLVDDREPDLKLLTIDELHAFLEAGATLRRLLAKARGEAPKAREPSMPPNPCLVALSTPTQPQPVADLAAQDERTIRAAMAAAVQPYTLAQLGLGR